MKFNKESNKFEPGVIYELGVWYEGDWHPVYVGETTNEIRRIKEHQGATKSGKKLLVYDYLRQLANEGIPFEMKVVEHYGSDGPQDMEDEHIMKLLLENYTLQNMKKGSNAWMTNMLKIKTKMLKSGHTSLRQFKVWDAEQTRIANDERHRLRVEEENKIPLIDRIKASTKFTDNEKLRQMEIESNQQKADGILMQLKRTSK